MTAPLPVTVVVMAKRPRAGAVKTRLCPPCTPVEAARLADSALADTLDHVRDAAVATRVLAFDEPDGFPHPDAFTVTRQAGGSLDRRLAAAACTVGGPVLLVGMDTPQATSEMIEAAAGLLGRGDVDAVLGDAEDGGFWAIGLVAPRPRDFVGVPMSRLDTGAWQLQRLRSNGRRVAALPVLRDVDDISDAAHVAAIAPHTRFARTFDALSIDLAVPR